MQQTLIGKADDVYANTLTDLEESFDEDSENINQVQIKQIKSFSLLSKGRVKEEDLVKFGIVDKSAATIVNKYNYLNSEYPSTGDELLLTIREAPSLYEMSSR